MLQHCIDSAAYSKYKEGQQPPLPDVGLWEARHGKPPKAAADDDDSTAGTVSPERSEAAIDGTLGYVLGFAPEDLDTSGPELARAQLFARSQSSLRQCWEATAAQVTGPCVERAGHPGEAGALAFLRGASPALGLVLRLGGLGAAPRGRCRCGCARLRPWCLCACGLLCLLALELSPAGRGEAHEVLLDFCTAYLHLVACHGVLFWRRYAGSHAFQRLVMHVACSTAELSDSGLARIHSSALVTQIRWLGQLALGVHVFFTFYLWVFIVLPLVLAVKAWEVNELVENTGAFRGMRVLVPVHALVMLFSTPLVLASLLLVPLMFGLAGLLHHLDAELAARVVRDPRFVPGLDGGMHRLVDSLQGTKLKGYGREQQFIFNSLCRDTKLSLVVDAVCGTALDAQERLAGACSDWEVLYLHTLIFGLLEVVAVCFSAMDVPPEIPDDVRGISRHLLKYVHPSCYPWHRTMSSLFHLLIGVLLLSSCLVSASLVTDRFRRLTKDCAAALRLRGVHIAHLLTMGLPRFLGGSVEGWTLLGFTVSAASASALAAVALAAAVCLLAVD